jgi:hypothetical protein
MGEPGYLEQFPDGWVHNTDDHWHRECVDAAKGPGTPIRFTMAVFPSTKNPGQYRWQLFDRDAEKNPVNRGGPCATLEEAKKAVEALVESLPPPAPEVDEDA